MARRGPTPKGDREQFTIRLPRTHLEMYRERARDAGLPLGDYLATQLAVAHELGEPEYVTRSRDQEELPISA